ncbi:prepilin-type N-terminal cleavage/methylation domain-containing protein [Candidatus Parcubacteria bacterium]|nr:prepilin-type N-terminal cleavage/methylation domain-containing protein [Candidatus Parcubacteria bacterium]
MSYNSLASTKITKRPARTSQSGFGLVELMVSISIMAIVSAIILARQDSFNSAVLLRSQAYEIALALREVQLSAVSASGDSGDFRTVYGVFFTSDISPASDPFNGYFQVFKDNNDNGYLDTGEEFGPRDNLDKRFEIKELRIGGSSETEATVVFMRPNFDALFYDGPSSLVDESIFEIDVARRNTAGALCGSEFRTVEVTRTGQIAVQNCP